MDGQLAPAELTESKSRLRESLQRKLGEQLNSLLFDPDVNNFMVNPDGKLWVERLGGRKSCEGFVEAAKVEAILTTVAAAMKTVIDEAEPILECRLPFNGSRLLGKIPPIVDKPSFNIRKHALQVFTLQDYVDKGTMTPAQREAIRAAVRNRKNILVVGGTNTGKTTLVNTIIGEIVEATPNDRVIILEDTQEIKCTAQDVVQYETSDTVNLQRLIKTALRDSPNRIFVGEVRGGEALDLMMAWNTGHPGGAGTVHANDARAGLIRMEQMIGIVSVQPQQKIIAQTVNVVVSIVNVAGVRRISEVIEVLGWTPEEGYAVRPM